MSSILSWGGGGEHKTTTTSITSMKDQSAALQGDVTGTFIGSGTTLAESGTAVHTEAGQNATTNLNIKGLTGGDVQGILSTVVSDSADERKSTSQLVTNLASSLGKEYSSAISQVGAAATGTPTNWTRYIPWMIGGGVILVYFSSKRKAA